MMQMAPGTIKDYINEIPGEMLAMFLKQLEKSKRRVPLIPEHLTRQAQRMGLPPPRFL